MVCLCPESFVQKVIQTALILLSIFVLFFIISYGKYSVFPTVESDNSLQMIEINDLKIHVDVSGSEYNPLVIVVHGGPGHNFRDILGLKRLSDEYFVVFYDQRGSGLSQRVPKSSCSIQNHVKDLKGIFDYYSTILNQEKTILIGHSWGGLLASAYLQKYPETVEKIVLAEPTTLTTETLRILLRRVNWFLPTRYSISGFVWMFWAFFKSFHVGPVYDGHEKMDWLSTEIVNIGLAYDMYALVDYFCESNPTTGVFEFGRFGWSAFVGVMWNQIGNNGEISLDVVSGIKERFHKKVLFLTGSCNKIIGEDYQRIHLSYFHNAELVVIEGAGHTFIGEKTNETISVIRDYLK